MIVQLADKALTQILRKPITGELPNVEYFKRPVTIECQNILGTYQRFETSFSKYFTPDIGAQLARLMKERPLRLDLTYEKKRARLKVYQPVDLHDLLPREFKQSMKMEFIYLESSVGSTFELHHSVLSDDRDKNLGLTQLFILIAYDTLNHLHAPRQTILVPANELRQAKKRKQALAGPLTTNETLVPRDRSTRVFSLIERKYELKVERVSKKPIIRQPEPRYWLKSEWDRKGHWRILRDKETGKIKKRIWIRPHKVKIASDVNRVEHLRISRF